MISERGTDFLGRFARFAKKEMPTAAMAGCCFTLCRESMSKSLFQISDDLKSLDNALADCDGSEQDPIFLDWFEKLATATLEERNTKLDNYGALISELEARSLARTEEAKRLQTLAKTDSNKAKRLKERLKFFFEQHGYGKIETDRYRFSLVKNGGKSPVVLNDDYDPCDMPEEFTRLERMADLAAIREALEAGEELEFAALGERGTSLRIS